ncbi:hypothetical protein [Pollutimonas bauzanensis]|nr:hypothetical protein [Pollutimonas bauzanensis]
MTAGNTSMAGGMHIWGRFMADQNAIEKLKKTLLEAKEFSVVWSAFFDLSEHPLFMRKSKMVKHRAMEQIIGEICRSILNKENADVGRLIILRYANTEFYHGLLATEGIAGNFMYFEGVDTGMMVLNRAGGGECLFTRFHLVPVSGPDSYLAPSQGRDVHSVH